VPPDRPVSDSAPVSAREPGQVQAEETGLASLGWAPTATHVAPVREPASEPDVPAMPGGLDPDPVSAGTHRGLPRRVRQSSLASELRASGPASAAGAPGQAPSDSEARSPEETRTMMSSLQLGWQRGRTDELEPAPGDGPGDPWDTEIMPRDGEAF
jgi:hypothetical protein